ncbi:MAG: ferredoxin [Gemmiger sp.]
MKFCVNDACIGCGLCVSTCPEVFSLTEAGNARAVNEPVDEPLLQSAMRAQDGCPVDAIESA